MSKIFLDRIRTELFNLQVSVHPQDLDEEVERITGLQCDEVARTYSKQDFKRVAEEAIKNIKKRKQQRQISEEEQMVYA